MCLFSTVLKPIELIILQHGGLNKIMIGDKFQKEVGFLQRSNDFIFLFVLVHLRFEDEFVGGGKKLALFAFEPSEKVYIVD